MTANVIAALTAVFSVIALIIKAYASGQPARQKEKDDETIQQGRQAIVNGDVDAVTIRLNRLLQNNVEAAGGSPPGKQDGEAPGK